MQAKSLIPTTKFHCGQQMNLVAYNRSIDGVAFRCVLCRNYVSIRESTFFSRSHLKLSQIFVLIFCSCNNLYNQKFLMKEFNLCSNTIVDWKNFIRDVYINSILNENSQIGGANVVVQVDESQICKRKYGVGRILANMDLWIVGGVDEQGNIFMELTERRNARVLLDILVRRIAPGSIVNTDGWPAYRNIGNDGFIHRVVVHDQNFVAPDGTHTQRIEAVWGACKRFYRPVTNKKRPMVFSYLAMYIFRRNHPKNSFSETLAEIARMYPVD